MIYLLLIALARIIGRKLLGQLTFFDFVTGITLGTVAGSFVTTEVQGYYVLLSLAIFTIMVIISGYIALKSMTIRNLIIGEPIILIKNGKIYEDNMRKIRYNQDILMMQLREKDVFDIEEVVDAILEPHGKLSVLKRSKDQPVTLKDLNIFIPNKGLPTELVKEGKILEQNLKKLKLSHEWLFNQLAAKSIQKIEDIFLASLSSEGKLYIDLIKDNPPLEK
ncbi:MAG: hypothetical protein APF84_04615 [Gracilibacter sp. BRH_c7a]|nr:MAG: hypothetical protein APF84_04615 [Gracilibacter sp. BRH_c7a]